MIKLHLLKSPSVRWITAQKKFSNTGMNGENAVSIIVSIGLMRLMTNKPMIDQRV